MAVTDRRIHKTRNAIDKAFWDLMKEKDFEEISVSDISEQADINRATFYHHFSDKYKWLDSTIEILLQDFIGFNAEMIEHRDTSDLREIFLGVFRCFDEQFDYFSILLKNKGTQFFQYRFKEIMVKLLSAQISPDTQLPLDKDFIIHYVASVSVSTIEWWIQNNRPLSAQEMGDTLYSLYCRMPWANQA